jgi:hypothetical protein
LLYNPTMSYQKPPRIRPNSGLFYEIQVRGRLVLRLMMDWRVNIFYKLIPIAVVIYVLSPYDLPGPFDDLAVFLFGIYLFVELCPPKVVQEHLDHIHGKTASPQDHDDDVIDAEFKILDANDSTTNSAGKKK